MTSFHKHRPRACGPDSRSCPGGRDGPGSNERRAAGGTTVTVTGTGFLPIAGADMAEVGTTMVAATCTTTTKCTIVTPKHAAATVNIQISAEDLAFSPVTIKDKYTYKP